jgi:putative ABC transport system substrate-binding protein
VTLAAVLPSNRVILGIKPAVRARWWPPMPTIAFLDSRPPDAISERLRAYRQGLKETGYVDGENVAIVYRFAENQNDRLPELAADLVRRQVAVIATAGDDVALVAKVATTTIPIVFIAVTPERNVVDMRSLAHLKDEDELVL